MISSVQMHMSCWAILAAHYLDLLALLRALRLRLLVRLSVRLAERQKKEGEGEEGRPLFYQILRSRWWLLSPLYECRLDLTVLTPRCSAATSVKFLFLSSSTLRPQVAVPRLGHHPLWRAT